MAVGGGASGGRAAGIEAGRAFVRIGGDNSDLKTVLGQSRKLVLYFSAALAKAGAGLMGLGGTFLAPIAASFREVLQHFDEFSKASDRTGATTEALSALAYAAEQSDASLGDVAAGTKFLQRNLSAAAAGGKEAQAALAKLGLTADDLKDKSLEEQFALVADGLAGIEDPADRTAAAIGVLGRGGLALVPMLRDGSDALRDLFKEAEDVGAVVKGEDARNATKIGDDISKSWTAVKNTFRAVGAALLPQVETIHQLSNVFVQAVKMVRDFITENRALVLGVTAGSAAVVALGAALVGMGAVLAVAVAGLSALGTVLGVVFSPAALLVGVIAALGVGIALLLDRFGAFDGMAEKLQVNWGGFLDTFRTTWQGIRDALAAGDLNRAFKVLTAGLKVIWLQFLLELQKAWKRFWGEQLAHYQGLADVIRANLGKGAAEMAIAIAAQAPDAIARRLAAARVAAANDSRLKKAQRELDRARGKLGEEAAGARDAAIAAQNDEMMDRFLRAMMGAAKRRQAVAEAVNEFAGVRGQFGGGGLASALGVGDQSIQKKQLEEQEKMNEKLEAIKDKVGGLPVE